MRCRSIAAVAMMTCAGCAPSDIQWRTDLAQAQAEARRAGCLVIAQITTPGRPLAQAMVEGTFADPAVIASLHRHVPVLLDAVAARATVLEWLGDGAALATCVLDQDDALIAARCGFVGAQAFEALVTQAEREAPRLARCRAAAESASASARLELAARLASTGCGHQARLVLERVATTDGEAAARLARLHLDHGRNREARHWWSVSERLGGGDSAYACLTLAKILFAERELRAARAVLERAESFGLEAPRAALLLGQTCHELGDDAQALEVLTRTLATGSVPDPDVVALTRHILTPIEPHSH